MDLLDVVIVAVTLAFGSSGYRRGLSWVSLSLGGLIIGLILGAAVAPPLAHGIARSRATQPLVASGIFLIIVLIVQGVGTAIGFQARVATLRTRLAQVDSSLGSGLAVIGTLMGAWYIGIVFSQSPWISVNNQIAGSFIVRTLDSVAPRPPAFLAKIVQTLHTNNLPNPFTALAPISPPPVDLPALFNTPGVNQAYTATSEVLATGCGGVEAGSSWPLGNGLMVTNAHVVAGSNQVAVQTDDGVSHRATVVLYDPDIDVAVLRTPDITLAGLPLITDDPPRGTQGAVIGFPGGGDKKMVPAAVRGEENAQGYNIYSSALVTRDIEVLNAQVIPGNSGGPVVDSDGRVIGLVFAASTADPSEGYALTISQIHDDLNAASGLTTPVSTQDCTQ